MEIVEAPAQGLAIERNAARPWLRAGRLQPGRVLAERGFDIGRRKSLKNIANGRVRRRSAPCETKRGIQFGAMHVDEGDDAAIGVAAGYDRQNGKQQHVGQLVLLALPAAGIRDL